jgi:uncharacterized protein
MGAAAILERTDLGSEALTARPWWRQCGRAVPTASDRMCDAMETPCIKVCVIEPGTNACTGCGRTLCEIARWSQLSAAERTRIMAELPVRLQPAVKRGEAR